MRCLAWLCHFRASCSGGTGPSTSSSPRRRSFQMNFQPSGSGAVKPHLSVLFVLAAWFLRGCRSRHRYCRAWALALYGPPVYVRHEIVHNRHVVESLRAKGAIFVEELDEIPDTNAPVVFSAHGVQRNRSRRRPSGATSLRWMRPARWSPRSIARRKFISSAGEKSR